MFNKKLKALALMMSLVFMFTLSAPAPAHAGFLDSITDKVKTVYDSAKETASKVVDTAKAVVDTAKTVAGKVIDTAKDVAANVTEVVKETAKKVYETAKNAVQGVVKAVTGIGSKAADTVKSGVDAVKDGVGNVADAVKDLPDQASQELSKAVDNVKDFIAGKKQDFNDFKKMVADFKDKGIDFLEEAVKEGNEKILHPVIARIQEDAQKLHEGAKKAITDFSAVMKTASKGLDLAKDQIGPLIDKDKNSIQLASVLGELKSADGSKSLSSSFSMGGFAWDTKKDIKGHAKGDISAHELLLSADAHLGPRFKAEGNAEFFGGKLAMTGSTDNTLGVWARGDGNAKFMKDGALIDAKGSVAVGAGFKSENEGQITTQLGGGYGTKTSGTVDILVGAEASAEGKAYAGKNGIELSGKAEARCGAWVEGSANHAVQYKGNDLFGVGVGGGVGAGLGAGVEGGFSFKANKIGFKDVGFTLGPVKVKGTFYVNPVGMAEMAIDKGKEAINAVKNVAGDLQEKGKKVLDKLTFWD